MYFNDEYELSSSTETDMLLVDLPLDLIKENLRYQISNPLDTTVNYVETIVDKVRVLRSSYQDNEDAKQNIDALSQDVFGFLINEIDDKFDLGIQVDFNDVQEVMDTAIILYTFLILRYKKNISKFVFKFITKNKKTMVEQFSPFIKRKDVTSIALKKKTKNKDDVLILANLPEIIKYIMNLDLDGIDFLRYSTNDENYEATYLSNLIASGNMRDDFVRLYLQLITNDYEHVLDEVQTDVRMKLLNKM